MEAEGSTHETGGEVTVAELAGDLGPLVEHEHVGALGYRNISTIFRTEAMLLDMFHEGCLQRLSPSLA
jgi:hypothetical protein